MHCVSDQCWHCSSIPCSYPDWLSIPRHSVNQAQSSFMLCTQSTHPTRQSWVHVHPKNGICGELFKDPQLLQEEQNNSSGIFFWPHLDVDVTSPGFCPSVAWNKTICPMRPCLNSCYHKYDSKHFKTLLFSFLWHTLGLCCINCWQSQGPDTWLEVAFLAFFFYYFYYFSHLLISELLTKANVIVSAVTGTEVAL